MGRPSGTGESCQTFAVGCGASAGAGAAVRGSLPACVQAHLIVGLGHSCRASNGSSTVGSPPRRLGTYTTAPSSIACRANSARSFTRQVIPLTSAPSAALNATTSSVPPAPLLPPAHHRPVPIEQHRRVRLAVVPHPRLPVPKTQTAPLRMHLVRVHPADLTRLQHEARPGSGTPAPTPRPPRCPAASPSDPRDGALVRDLDLLVGFVRVERPIPPQARDLHQRVSHDGRGLPSPRSRGRPPSPPRAAPPAWPDAWCPADTLPPGRSPGAPARR